MAATRIARRRRDGLGVGGWPGPGCGASASEGHHKLTVRARPDLRLRWSNLDGKCNPCHSRITATEQSFGRA